MIETRVFFGSRKEIPGVEEIRILDVSDERQLTNANYRNGSHYVMRIDVENSMQVALTPREAAVLEKHFRTHHRHDLVQLMVARWFELDRCGDNERMKEVMYLSTLMGIDNDRWNQEVRRQR